MRNSRRGLKPSNRKQRRLGIESLENRQLLTVMINEVLTSNGTDLSTRVRIDAGSAFVSLPITPDWIELHNDAGTAFDLSGYHLTDNNERPTRWEFPAGTSVPANGHLVVFASGENTNDTALDETGRLHTNFVLSSSGEYLALTDGNGVVVDRLDVPKMNRDVSYGFDASGNGGFYTDTTPGETNSTAQVEFVSDTSFSHKRGLYDAPFDVTITSATDGAVIAYTLDGTEPTVNSNNVITNGSEYTAPISITTTSNLRAMAFKAGAISTNVDTQSYIFPADVLQQSAADIPPSSSWGSSGPDWEMDPEVVNLPDGDSNKPTVEDFAAIPTVSVTMDWNELFGPNGIYRIGEHIETAMSFEFFDPATGESTQQNASIEVQGGSSVSVPRNWKTDKISMLVRFQDPYGPTTLDANIFGEGATTVFDQMTIDGQLNFVWDYGSNNTQRSQALYIHDQVAADVQNAISGEGAAPHGRFVHLYRNNVYWGMHYLHERPDESFAAEYYGGDKEEYHALNQNKTISQAINPDGSPTGNNAATQDLDDAVDLARLAGNGGLAEWDAVNEQIDVEHFIDYLLMNWYLGNEDWGADNKNWYASRKNTPDGRWRFHSWDAEKVFQNFSSGGVGKVGLGPKGLHDDLMGNAEYELLFADRIQDLMFNGGVLTEESLVPIFQARVDEVEAASRTESARWGDNRVSSPYMREDLMANFQSVFDNFFPVRHERVLNDLIDEGVYPEISAPVFEIEGTSQHGGAIMSGDALTMTAKAATIETETTLVALDATVKAFVPADGSLETGATKWYDVDFDDAAWTSGNSGVGFGSDYDDIYGVDVSADWAANPSSLYTRYEFELDGDTSQIAQLELKMKYDDGYVVYLNGQVVKEGNAPENAQWDSRATAKRLNLLNTISTVFESTNLADSVDLLQPGKNVLAIHGLNHATDQADMLIRPVLEMVEEETLSAPIVYTLDGTDPREIGGNSVGTTYDNAIPLDNSTVVKARAFVGGQWSALTTATFSIPASPTDIQITEINFNPHQPTDAESTLLPDVGNDDFEFIEISNTNLAADINLAGMEFVNGVEYTFGNVVLEAGESAVVVEDIEAFEARYGDSVNVIGQWSGGLSNNGETVELADGAGNLLVEVAYDDNDPWFARADGVGATLQLKAGDLTANPDKYYQWQASRTVGGSPGAANGDASSIVINEIRASSDELAGEVDAIELYNAGEPIDLSGWFLSDSSANLFKYELPAGTMLPSNSYLTISETDFNPADGSGFALRSAGDDVWLVKRDAQGNLEAFGDDVHFNGTANSETLGRVPNGTGRLAPLATSSLGAMNGAARVGPLVISEVHYNPGAPSAAAITADDAITSNSLEFVEIHNPTTSAVDLTDWRIRGGIDLDFDEATMLASGETVVVLSFNPSNPDNASRVAAFRAQYGLGDDVRLVGGYSGQLNNGYDRVELQRPGTPPMDEPNLIPRLLEDEVLYDDTTPWPATADGTGMSLSRVSATAFGNDAATWNAASPSPGQAVFSNVVPGDLNGDNVADAGDMNFLCSAIDEPFDATYDFDNNGTLELADTQAFIEGTLGSRLGDSNLDGRVDALDLNRVGINWLTPGPHGWESGNFNCDDSVNSADLNLVGLNWQFGVAARSPRAPLAAAVTPILSGERNIELRKVGTVPTSANEVDNEASANPINDIARRQIRDYQVGRRSRANAEDVGAEDVGADDHKDVNERLVDEIFAGL